MSQETSSKSDVKSSRTPIVKWEVSAQPCQRHLPAPKVAKSNSLPAPFAIPHFVGAYLIKGEQATRLS